MLEYNDDYPTCLKTYATLRIYHDALIPDSVSQRLGIEPTESQVKGQILDSTGRLRARIGGWFLSTLDTIESKDSRAHIDGLLDRLEGKGEVLQLMRAEGYSIDISCYWLSASGHGGPLLSPGTMARAVRLGLDIWFDVYFSRLSRSSDTVS